MNGNNDEDMSTDTSDGRWLSYDQLASLRRIDKPSAVKLATRNRWPRRKNNLGQMQVCVPLPWLERARDRHDKYTDVPPDEADKSTDISHAIKALETALQFVTARAESAEKRASEAEIARDAERNRANQAEQALSAERSRADQAEVAADKLESELNGEKIARAEAEADATELRQAEEQRKGQGRWARLRAAWRGE